MVRTAYNIWYFVKDDEENDIADFAQKDNLVYPTFILIYYGLVDLIPMAGQFVAVRIMPKPKKHKKLNMSNQGKGNFVSTSEETVGLLPSRDESIIIRSGNSENTLFIMDRSNSPEGEESNFHNFST